MARIPTEDEQRKQKLGDVAGRQESPISVGGSATSAQVSRRQRPNRGVSVQDYLSSNKSAIQETRDKLNQQGQTYTSDAEKARADADALEQQERNAWLQSERERQEQERGEAHQAGNYGQAQQGTQVGVFQGSDALTAAKQKAEEARAKADDYSKMSDENRFANVYGRAAKAGTRVGLNQAANPYLAARKQRQNRLANIANPYDTSAYQDKVRQQQEAAQSDLRSQAQFDVDRMNEIARKNRDLYTERLYNTKFDPSKSYFGNDFLRNLQGVSHSQKYSAGKLPWSGSNTYTDHLLPHNIMRAWRDYGGANKFSSGSLTDPQMDALRKQFELSEGQTLQSADDLARLNRINQYLGQDQDMRSVVSEADQMKAYEDAVRQQQKQAADLNLAADRKWHLGQALRQYLTNQGGQFANQDTQNILIERVLKQLG